MQRKYSEEELQQMKKKASKVVLSMTAGSAGIGAAPVIIDIGAFMVAMGGSVVAIGRCYDFKITKEEAGQLIKQFFCAAGMAFSFIFAGQKIVTSLLKSNPVSYTPSMAVDAVMCSATAYAIGSTSQQYFHKLAQGKTVSNRELRQWMQEGKKTGKTMAKGC